MYSNMITVTSHVINYFINYIFSILFKCHIPSVLQLFVALWRVMQ